MVVVVVGSALIVCEQGIYNGRVSVRPSVCPVIRPQQRLAAGLLLSAPWAEISIDSGGRRESSSNSAAARGRSTALSSKCG